MQSRYYDPTTCRFINADSYASTGQGIIGHNMFAYCGNNPVNYSDPLGMTRIGRPILENAIDCPPSKSPMFFTKSQKQYYAALKKYNSSTVNVYFKNSGEEQAGKVNAMFYIASSANSYINIHLSPSLDIRSSYEMNAILDVIMEGDYYSAEQFGTKEFMRAQWVAHNVCYDIASSGDIGFAIMQFLSGSSNPIESSQVLDIRSNGNMLRRQKILYTVLSWFI